MEFGKDFGFQIFVFSKTYRIFQNLLIKCLIHPLKHHQNFHNFLTSMNRSNTEKDVKKFKKIVNDGVLEKKWISNISIFLKRIHNFPVLFDKIST